MTNSRPGVHRRRQGQQRPSLLMTRQGGTRRTACGHIDALRGAGRSGRAFHCQSQDPAAVLPDPLTSPGSCLRG